jgi:hypothetical protein
MVEMLIRVEALEGVVSTVLEQVKNGRIDDAIARFAEEFSFKDHGIGLEFRAWPSSSRRHGNFIQAQQARIFG